TSTLRDQAHHALDRKLFMTQGCHHAGGSQPAFLTGLAHLYNLIPYQRRAQHAGQCGVAVEGGRVPTADWFLNLQLLTSGGFRSYDDTLYHVIWWSAVFFVAQPVSLVYGDRSTGWQPLTQRRPARWAHWRCHALLPRPGTPHVGHSTRSGRGRARR